MIIIISQLCSMASFYHCPHLRRTRLTEWCIYGGFRLSQMGSFVLAINILKVSGPGAKKKKIAYQQQLCLFLRKVINNFKYRLRWTTFMIQWDCKAYQKIHKQLFLWSAYVQNCKVIKSFLKQTYEWKFAIALLCFQRRLKHTKSLLKNRLIGLLIEIKLDQANVKTDKELG